MPDPALEDAIFHAALDEIQDDWATLSGDPEAVARRIAKRLAVLYGDDDDDPIQGAAWSSR